MSSATETLCGQAYGAKQYHMLGVYLQRSWIINLAIGTILLPLYLFTTPIYLLLGQDEAIAKRAGVVSLWFIPFLFQGCLSTNTQMFLQAQMRNRIVGWLSLASLAIHVLLSRIFVDKLNLGVPGAMVAFNISYWMIVVGQFVYIFGGWCPGTWTGFTTAAFTDLWPVLKLSVSSGVMLWGGCRNREANYRGVHKYMQLLPHWRADGSRSCFLGESWNQRNVDRNAFGGCGSDTHSGLHHLEN
uniref:Uncharacterized protein n=1 Tax=Kalanchoe fedtschenkoi TaxID=63787 RepID=A0A7N0VMG1_KALFE